MTKRRTRRRVTAARGAAVYRDRKARGRTLIKTEPVKQDLVEAVHAFAHSPQAANFPEIKRDLATIRAGLVDWATDKRLLGRVMTAVADEWSDRWRRKNCQG